MYPPGNDDSFVPDSFTPDESDSFVPDETSNEPKEWNALERLVLGLPPNGQNVNKPTGKWVKKGLTQQWVADERQSEDRPDTRIWNATENFDKLRELGVNKVANNSLLPEGLKPYAAMATSASLEPLRFLAEVLAEPDVAATGIAGGLRRLFGGRKSAPEVITPEVLPPEEPVIRGLLEPPPYVAGPGGVQRRDLLYNNPQEEARLLGHEFNAQGAPIGTKGDFIPPGASLAELREAERIKRLRYTDRDLQGGSPLILEPKADANIPARPYSTRLGTDEFTRDFKTHPHDLKVQELSYPENVIPSAVMPRRAQTGLESLVPERFSNPIPESAPIKFGNEQVPKPITPKAAQDMLGGTRAIGPDEIILPSAVKRTKRNVKENTGLNAPVTSKEVKLPENTPSDVKDGIKVGVQNFVKEKENPSIISESVYTQLKNLGPAGNQIVHKAQRAAQIRSEYDAVWTEPLFKVGDRLKQSEFDNFGAYVEGTMPIPNDRVRRAVDAWTKSQNMMGDMAVNKQLHLKRGDEVIPFEKISENYWPHIPAEALTKKTIIDKLMANGMSRHDAVIVAKKWESTGEIFLRGQHSRLKDTFPYRQDFDVAIHHGRSMSKRIANHEQFGPKDVAGFGDEGIAKLIEDTGSPDLALVLAKRLVGRDELPNARLVKGLNQTRKYMSLVSLPSFTIPNVILGQMMNAHMALMSRHPVKAAMEVTKLFRSAYRDQIRSSGVYNSFNRTLVEELSGLDPWQIGAGEKINRSVAAAIGKSTVREAFTDLKNGENVASARYFLETLLARNPDEITAITPELERFAAGRMAEITQGLNNPGNLPYGWTNPVNSYGQVATQLALIFKKIGFQVTKTVKDTIMSQPTAAGKAKAIASWAALTQVGGEMVGDVKSIITGRERPEELALRVADNWGNAFMLGLPWELITSSQYGPQGLIAAAAGPAFGKGSELAYSVGQTGKRLYNDQEDPFGPVRRFGLKNLPIPGRERIKKSVEDED